MASYSGGVLGGSTNGRPIPVTATSTPGTLVHTVASGTAGFDEVFLFASNVSANVAALTVEFGGTSSPGDHLVSQFAVPGRSVGYPIAVGQRLQNGLSVRAFSDVSAAINLSGWYNRVS